MSRPARTSRTARVMSRRHMVFSVGIHSRRSCKVLTRVLEHGTTFSQNCAHTKSALLAAATGRDGQKAGMRRSAYRRGERSNSRATHRPTWRHQPPAHRHSPPLRSRAWRLRQVGLLAAVEPSMRPKVRPALAHDGSPPRGRQSPPRLAVDVDDDRRPARRRRVPCRGRWRSLKLMVSPHCDRGQNGWSVKDGSGLRGAGKR